MSFLKTGRSSFVAMCVLMLCAAGALTAAGDDGDGREEPRQKRPLKAKLNELAPDFTLKDTKDQEHTLSDLEGKIVVLEWFNTECGFVRRHYGSKSMQKTYEEVKKLDKTVVWLAINSTYNTTTQVNNYWIRQYKLKYPILLDTDGKVGKAFDARTTPHMFVIDAEGILRYHGAIDDNPLGGKPAKDVTNYVVQAVTQITEEQTVEPDHVKPYGCSVKYATRPPVNGAE